MSVLVLVEVEDGRASLVSREALSFARSLAAGDVHAVLVGAASEQLVADCREAGVAVVHEAVDPALERYAAAAWAAVVEAAGRAARSDLVIAPGTGRGNEVLAHVAARRGLQMAANVVSVASLGPARRRAPGRRRGGPGASDGRRAGSGSSPWPATRSSPPPPRPRARPASRGWR